MATGRQIITCTARDGTDQLGMHNLALKRSDNAIVSGSLLTVEPNQFAIFRERGILLQTYEMGQYTLVTEDKPFVGNFVRAFAWGGDSPWVYEIVYVNRSKLMCQNHGTATTSEMAEVSYTVDYYIQINTPTDANLLVQHLPFNGLVINTQEVAAYAGPAIEQSINQVIQTTKLEEINTKISDLREGVQRHLAEFLIEYGIHLHDLKILVVPKDERMRGLISLQALGLSPKEAAQFYLAFQMAEKGLLSAPNAAAGAPFHIGGNTLTPVNGKQGL
jgi:membrane protease subunit (stomatin/prohibitin family)